MLGAIGEFMMRKGQRNFFVFLVMCLGLLLTGDSPSHAERQCEPLIVEKKVVEEVLVCPVCSLPKPCFWVNVAPSEAVKLVEGAITYLDTEKRYFRGRKQAPILSKKTRRYYASRIVMECYRRQIDPIRFTALIWIESGFNHKARSHAGARGLCQIMPFWVGYGGEHLDLARIEHPDSWQVEDLYDPDTNIYLGVEILHYYLKQRKGNFRRAMASYNGSLGWSWYPNMVDRVYRDLLKQGFIPGDYDEFTLELGYDTDYSIWSRFSPYAIPGP